MPLAILSVLYLVLLITPIRLPFSGGTVRGIVQSALPENFGIEMGDLAIAVENGVWPVIQFSPVVLTDTQSGARIAMDALEVGFSPWRILIGQPGASVTVVGPHLQVVQDLYGPRLARMEIVEDPNGGMPTLRVLEGETAFSPVDIRPEGLTKPIDGKTVRSDNDWLVYNFESMETSLRDFVDLTRQGLFSRFTVRDARIDMTDSVYGLYRRFEDANIEIGTNREGNVAGTFSALVSGRAVTGSVERVASDAGDTRLRIDATNLDFAAALPFIDDASSMAAMRGAGALSLDVAFNGQTGKVIDGMFRVDLTGIDLRVGRDYFPVVSSIMEIAWNPELGQFRLADSALQIGQSTARLSGIFAMGLDATYGPTIGMSVRATKIAIHPNDMDAPAAPFETMDFAGWSAPLYGAMGIDRFVARRGDAVIETTGRIDMLQTGMGVDMTVAGEGVTADDVKRIWPYIMGGETRDWFVANVTEGKVAKGSRLEFNIPVGALSLDGEAVDLPEDAMNINIVGEGVVVRATDTMDPIAVDGLTRLQVRGSKTTISADGGTIETAQGNIAVRRPAMIFDTANPDQSIFEVSGNLASPIPALLAIAEQIQPGALGQVDLPIDPSSISGNLDLGLVATIGLPPEGAEGETDVDYVVTGTVKDFASSEPIQSYTVGNGQLSFSATQDGYTLGGTAEIGGIEAELAVEGTSATAPVLKLGSTLEVADLAQFGFDASEFLSGSVRFVAEPSADGSLKMSIDLADAGLTIKDLGLRKASGTPGSLTATIRPDGEVTHLEEIVLGFGSVQLAGELDFHATDGLVSAEFDQFALSQGDSAQVSLSPVENGFAVRIRGEQLDLKPVLSNFFSLDSGSGGVQTTQINQAISLDVQLDRALGYYATTAFNVDLELSLRGSDLRRATLSAQFNEGNAVSITTNPAPRGRTMSVAFNDAGTLLRFLGVYSQLAGGSGSLVLTTDRDADAEAGRLLMRGFSIVDEANVAQVLGNHSDSRAAIARQNRLDFEAGEVDFIRRTDRVEVTRAVLSGSTVGGTMRGYIYTGSRQYDLTGTYVPLFGLNNAFQQIPLLGPILGGRDGEGLVGVTFAVRGPLDDPQFQINPLSLLVPGAFRELFEFRAREAPAQ
ncbi:AsmA-like C-terminal region [Devosia crocina]|uniref:AsmA-like C-terminal region n=1 Tax=Devosia crocina TaxID=429728 RepID=A0A1I7NAG4_9HYPH|nr:AsmA-like C-terminal domain-containing protein [Devosia crocina]SFV31621.1 AsmA-like C-terminal region [Devosia crocina]